MAQLQILFPHWTQTLAAMIARKVLVRSQCLRCGMQHRVEPLHLQARLGPQASLLDRLDPCMVVGCHGQVFYLATPTFGRPWLPLVADPDRRAALGTLPAPENAVTLRQRRGG